MLKITLLFLIFCLAICFIESRHSSNNRGNSHTSRSRTSALRSSSRYRSSRARSSSQRSSSRYGSSRGSSRPHASSSRYGSSRGSSGSRTSSSRYGSNTGSSGSHLSSSGYGSSRGSLGSRPSSSSRYGSNTGSSGSRLSSSRYGLSRESSNSYQSNSRYGSSRESSNYRTTRRHYFNNYGTTRGIYFNNNYIVTTQRSFLAAQTTRRIGNQYYVTNRPTYNSNQNFYGTTRRSFLADQTTRRYGNQLYITNAPSYTNSYNFNSNTARPNIYLDQRLQNQQQNYQRQSSQGRGFKDKIISFLKKPENQAKIKKVAIPVGKKLVKLAMKYFRKKPTKNRMAVMTPMYVGGLQDDFNPSMIDMDTPASNNLNQDYQLIESTTVQEYQMENCNYSLPDAFYVKAKTAQLDLSSNNGTVCEFEVSRNNTDLLSFLVIDEQRIETILFECEPEEYCCKFACCQGPPTDCNFEED